MLNWQHLALTYIIWHQHWNYRLYACYHLLRTSETLHHWTCKMHQVYELKRFHCLDQFSTPHLSVIFKLSGAAFCLAQPVGGLLGPLVAPVCWCCRKITTCSLRHFFHTLSHFRTLGLICKQPSASISRNMTRKCHWKMNSRLKLTYRLVCWRFMSTLSAAWLVCSQWLNAFDIWPPFPVDPVRAVPDFSSGRKPVILTNLALAKMWPDFRASKIQPKAVGGGIFGPFLNFDKCQSWVKQCPNYLTLFASQTRFTHQFCPVFNWLHFAADWKKLGTSCPTDLWG